MTPWLVSFSDLYIRCYVCILLLLAMLLLYLLGFCFALCGVLPLEFFLLVVVAIAIVPPCLALLLLSCGLVVVVSSCLLLRFVWSRLACGYNWCSVTLYWLCLSWCSWVCCSPHLHVLHVAGCVACSCYRSSRLLLSVVSLLSFWKLAISL